MPGRGKPRADARKRKQETEKTSSGQKRARTHVDTTSPSTYVASTQTERITLSVDENTDNRTQGNVLRPPLVEKKTLITGPKVMYYKPH